MMIIKVLQPSFWYNTKSPLNVVYNIDYVCEPDEYWKLASVQTYKNLPEPNTDEVLYKYTENRGYLYKIENGSSLATELPPILNRMPDTPARRNQPDLEKK